MLLILFLKKSCPNLGSFFFGVLGVGCWVLGVGCWVLGVGCWGLGVGRWGLGVGRWVDTSVRSGKNTQKLLSNFTKKPFFDFIGVFRKYKSPDLHQGLQKYHRYAIEVNPVGVIYL